MPTLPTSARYRSLAADGGRTDSRRRTTARSAAIVGKAVDKLKAAGLDAEGLQREGDPKSVIIETAQEIRASRIVLGSRGASGVDRLLLGSVALVACNVGTASLTWAISTLTELGRSKGTLPESIS